VRNLRGRMFAVGRMVVATACLLGGPGYVRADILPLPKPRDGGGMKARASEPVIAWGTPERAINGEAHGNGWASDKPGAWLAIDLGSGHELNRVDYHPCPTAGMRWKKDYAVYVSDRPGPDDGRLLSDAEARELWGEPVAAGRWPDSADRQSLKFKPRKGRYVVFHSPSSENGWVTVQEVDIFDSGAWNRMTTSARTLRAHYLQDPYRPGYHFTVPEGVHMPIDPNGALYWNGRYHVFYIYQEPGEATNVPVKIDKQHYWGHISSIDLVHWRHHPPALAPGEGDAGIFSGGVFVDRQGVPTISYWGLGNPRGICLATSTDPNLDRWVKSPHNPVIRETGFGVTTVKGPDGKDLLVGASDPSAIWWRDGRYQMLTGNLQALEKTGKTAGDRAYLFQSDDLLKWDYRGEFYESRRDWTAGDEDCMCPDFFPLPSGPDGGKPTDTWMLLCISHNKGCRYYLGEYAGERFLPRRHERMTWAGRTWGGNALFAPETVIDDRGRRIMVAWVFGWHEVKRGWSGTLSLPWLLWRGDDDTARMRPVPELAALRYNHREKAPFEVAAGQEVPLPEFAGGSLDLEITLSADGAGARGITVLGSADGAERTVIEYHPDKGELVVDGSRSGEGPRGREAAPLKLPPGEPLQLRVLVDRSIIEVFANDRQAAVFRAYPSKADSTGVSIFAREADVKVLAAHAWDMMEAMPW
jgi:beta-fructofuranosidase